MREELDLGAILSVYTEVRGFPPGRLRGAPRLQAVTALNQPDFRTISEFRRCHLVALGDLFVQVLALCQRAGLVGLGHVAVDGTKLRANASNTPADTGPPAA